MINVVVNRFNINNVRFITEIVPLFLIKFMWYNSGVVMVAIKTVADSLQVLSLFPCFGEHYEMNYLDSENRKLRNK